MILNVKTHVICLKICFDYNIHDNLCAIKMDMLVFLH